MKKQDILKMTGLTEKEFYERYPTEESFMMEYGGRINSYATGGYSAKDAAAGKDIGKPGKNFAKIAKEAGETYGSEEAGERVAGAILAKLRARRNGGKIYADGGPTGDGYVGVQFTDRGLDPERMKELGAIDNMTGFNRGLTDLEFSNAASRQAGVYGGIPLNRSNTLYGTGALGISETISRTADPSYSSPQGYKMLDWKSDTSPYAEAGLRYKPGNMFNPNYKKGVTLGETGIGVGVSYDNNKVSPYMEFNPEVGYNFGNRILGTKSKKNQPFTVYGGMDLRVRPFKGEDLYDVGGGQQIARDPGINERASGAQRANFYAGLEGRTRDGLGIYGKVATDPGLRSTLDGSPMYTIGVRKQFKSGGYTNNPTGDIFDMMGMSYLNKYAEGGSLDEQLSAANDYNNWILKERNDETKMYRMGGVPKYGLGDIIPGVGDAILGTVDTGLSVFGGQDIIGDKQYSDTGLGRTIKDASHYTSAIYESLVPTVVSYIPGIGQIVAPALNAVQLGVDALTPDDKERLQSESGRNAMYLGMGLDVAGAVTSLGTGAAKAATTTGKLAKAAKVANTVSDIAQGAVAAKNVYDVASSDNASIGDWIGAAAGAAGAGSGFAKEGSQLSKTLSKGSKFGKMAQTGYNIGETLDKTGNLDMASTLGLAADITNTAAGKDTKAGTLLDIGSLGARTYQASQAGQPALATGLSTAGSALAMAPTVSQTFGRKMPKNSPFGVPSDMQENTEYNNMLSGGTEYMKYGGYAGMNNFSKFANGGTVMGNIERNELTVVPGQYGAGGSPKVVADYSNFPSHPADGSLNHEATIPLPYSEENPYFIIPKKYRNKALRADKLEMEALTKKISSEKEKKEAQEMAKASTAYERFMSKYGGTIEKMYGCGGSVYGCGGKIKYQTGGPAGPRDVGYETYAYDFAPGLGTVLAPADMAPEAPLTYSPNMFFDASKYTTPVAAPIDKNVGVGTVLAPKSMEAEPVAYSPTMFFDISKYAPKETTPAAAPSYGPYASGYKFPPQEKQKKPKKEKQNETWLSRNAETLATVGMMSPALYNLGMGLFSKPQRIDVGSGNIAAPKLPLIDANAQKEAVRRASATERYAARRAAGSSPAFLSYLTQNANRRLMSEALVQEEVDRYNQQMLAKEALSKTEVDKYNKEAEMKRQIFNMQSEAARRAMIAEGMSNVGAIADKLRQNEIYKKRVYPNLLAGSAYTYNPDGTITVTPKKD